MPVDRLREADLTIASHQGDYAVRFAGSEADLVRNIRAVEDPFLVVDERVYGLYASLFKAIGVERVHVLPATEEEKTLHGVERIASFLQKNGASKRSSLVVFGGGVIQDVGTFAAHIYYRGIPYHFVPTTLLSMADSCIGAKCGVNLGAFKNQLGFFQSPKAVHIWPQFVRTLAPDDIRSGFGEVLKLAVTQGPDSLAWLEARMASDGFGIEGIDDVIGRSLRTKQRIIEEDEYERDLRKTLNYGHTFGHALESVTHHEVPHGLAVAWGVDVANLVSMRRKMLPESAFERIHAIVARHFTSTTTHRYDAASLMAAMRSDKKAAAGSVQLILPDAGGTLSIVPTRFDDAFQAAIAEYLSLYDVCSPRA